MKKYAKQQNPGTMPLTWQEGPAVQEVGAADSFRKTTRFQGPLAQHKGGTMQMKKFLLLLLLTVSFITAAPVGNQFFNLEKTAVSSLPDDLFAPDLKSVVVDRNGNIFAFAGLSNRNGCFIVKFDKNLNFLKKFGGDGRGPAEFTTRNSMPDNRLSIDPDNGDVYVLDFNPRRILVFDNNGNYKKETNYYRDYFKSLGNIVDIKTVGGGTFTGSLYRDDKPDLGVIFTLAPAKIKLEYPFNHERITYYGGNVSFSRDFCGDHQIIDTDSGYIVFASSQVYKFQVYDREGNLKLEVYDKNRRMGPFSDREMDYIKKEILSPNDRFSKIENDFLKDLNANKSEFNMLLGKIKKSKNVIAGVNVPGDRIYVFPVREDITIQDKYPVRVYDFKGKIVKEGYLKKKPARIWKDYFFFYDRDDEDNPLILKYKMTESY
jgi:hypothetical protein